MGSLDESIPSPLEQREQSDNKLVDLPHCVFTYGTLKRHQPNHHFIEGSKLGEQRLIGKARTVEQYPLIIATRWRIPFLLWSPGKGQRIYGEVYQVDDRLLAWMDKFEGHPGVYRREKIPIRFLGDDIGSESGHPLMCWTYFLKEFPPGLLNKETISNYDVLVTPYLPDKDLNGPKDIEEGLLQEAQESDQRSLELHHRD